MVRQAEIDRGQRDGVTTEERERIKHLERENRELRRANEIRSAGHGRSDPAWSGGITAGIELPAPAERARRRVGESAGPALPGGHRGR